MGRSGMRASACALVAGLALIAVPAAGAKTVRSVYTPHGWTGSASYGGLCLQSLTCPKVTFGVTNGKHGFLHTGFGSLLGVGGRASAAWTSNAFRYHGAAGHRGKQVKVQVNRRSSAGSLLSVAGNAATYTVSIVNARNGNVVAEAVRSAKLANATSWTRVGPKRVSHNQLKRGHSYRIRITTTVVNGADVIPGIVADYTGAKLVAKKHLHRH